jgi:GT2 family glycosyltransferase/glycosyltransferase involved in cell wall biosynthesis
MQYLKSPCAGLSHEPSANAPTPQSLYAVLVEKEQEIMRLRGEAAAREQFVHTLRARLNTREHELRAQLLALQSGGAWRLVQKLRHWRRTVAPAGTHRDRLLRILKRALQVWRREGVPALFKKTARKSFAKSKGLMKLSLRSLSSRGGVKFQPPAGHADRVDVSAFKMDSRPPPTGVRTAPAAARPRADSPTNTRPEPLFCPVLTAPDSTVFREILAFSPRRFAPLEKPIDVIVPVYKGLNETLRCILSVLTAEPACAHELIVINDASPDSTLIFCLRKIAGRGLITLLDNPANLGFVKTANRGLCLHPDRDVVLINSDTEVSGDWLQRLRRAAYSAANVGTVTPLSNNATICSYPAFCEDNAIPDDVNPVLLDQLCAGCNEGSYVEVPTGVGFCLYFRRDCLDATNLLDEEHFGKGYGEENDFCMRAMERGWRHLLTLDTFVYHRGGTSFGTDKEPAINRAMKVMESIHPDYSTLVGGHLRANPALPFRRRLDLARLAGPRPSLLYITHNRGGGTERHVLDLANRLEREGSRAIVLRPLDASRVRLERPAVKATPNLVFAIPEEYWTLREALRELGVGHIHVHHSIDLPGDVFRLIGDLNLPYDWTIHDYYSICPRINLIDETGVYCGEPGAVKCQVCLEQNGAYGGEPVDILRWREEYGAWLAGARKVFVPHRDVAVRLTRYFPTVEFTERRHFETYITARPVAAPLAAGETLRIAVIGSIGPHKGLDIVMRCARDGLARNLPLAFHIVGHTACDDAVRALKNVAVTGAYKEEDIFDILGSLHCHCAFFPSVWPETYTYTLSIAFLGGLFPIAFDLGAPAARIREHGFGHLIPLTRDAVAINDELLALSGQLAGAGREERWTPVSYKTIMTDYYGLTGNDGGQRRNVA